jgi:2-C-methyl-D-erythritol 2,4-cyclodiphosphate synthase
MHVGIGYDIHRLVENRPLILGGVTVPHDKGLLGHSDGDALAHAISDAILGAAALGNIGRHFPDTDPRYKDADSLAILRKVVELAGDVGYRVGNVDANIIAQQPKLDPYLDDMRERLAACLDVPVELVSVKARTNEEVGPEGRGEAIRTEAIVLLERSA